MDYSGGTQYHYPHQHPPAGPPGYYAQQPMMHTQMGQTWQPEQHQQQQTQWGMMPTQPPPGAMGMAGAPAGGDPASFQQGYQAAIKDVSIGKGGGGSGAQVVAQLINTGLFFGFTGFLLYQITKAGGPAGMNEKMMERLTEKMNPVQKRNFRVDVKDVKFDDVIGIPEAKEEVQQYVNFLKNPDKFTALGARLPKGALLTGRPGTGKTLLAKAVAGEAGVPFFSCSGADFIEIFGGSGPKRVRELFEEAKKETPSVIFVDELDAVGGKRQGEGQGGMGGEENRTTNALLAEMDGMGTNHAVVVLAATNHPEALDAALTRPGRFDRKIEIPVPDEKARVELFEFYLKKITTAANFEQKSQELKKKIEEQKEANEKKKNDSTLATKTKELEKLQKQLTELKEKKEKKANQAQLESVLAKQIAKLEDEVKVKDVWEPDLTPPTEEQIEEAKKLVAELAARTPGVTPASISTISNEAALVAADKNASFVTREHIADAIDNVLIGKKHRQRMSDVGLTRVAYHEAGHCLAQWFLGTQTRVIKVSVIPRGRAGGYCQFRDQEALDPKTDQYLFDQIVVCLAGRCAEKIFFEDFSTGASDDLTRAFDMAKNTAQAYGMDAKVGHIGINVQGEQRGRAFSAVSENLKSRIEDQGRELVDKAYKQCMTLLTENKPKLEELAQRIIADKEIGEDVVKEILGPKVVDKPHSILAETAEAARETVNKAAEAAADAADKVAEAVTDKVAEVAAEKVAGVAAAATPASA